MFNEMDDVRIVLLCICLLPPYLLYGTGMKYERRGSTEEERKKETIYIFYAIEYNNINTTIFFSPSSSISPQTGCRSFANF
jgi:hypothetical protein